MICNKCNKEIPNDAKFCPACGNNLANSNNNIQNNYQQSNPINHNNQQNYNNQQFPVNYNTPNYSRGGFDKKQKIIISSLVVILLFVSSIVLFTGKTSIFRKDDSRTIMIYVDGSNLETDGGIVTSDLESLDADLIDFEKTNILIYTGGTTKWQNDFISNEENAIFIFTPDGFKKIKTYDKLNMGDPNTLSEFINYSYENYKTGHYNLVLYNHGGAIDGAIYDDFTKDHLSLEDLSKAMNDSPFNEKNKLDNVIFRTCLNGTLEVASIFKNFTDYVVFSEEVTYGGDSDVLSFVHKVLPSDEGVEVGKKFISRYQEQVDDLDIFGTLGVTYSIIDTSKIDEVITELDKFTGSINVAKNFAEISKVRANLFQYGEDSTDYDTVDLYSLVEQVEKYSSVSSDNLKKAINEAIIFNHTNIDTSHGLSIYFPYKGTAWSIPMFLRIYDKLDFSNNYRKLIKEFYFQKANSMKVDIHAPREYETTISEDKEVSIRLNEEEINNYANASFTIFKKDENNNEYYQPIYSSNDVNLDDNGFLTTTIGDNLIKINTNEGTRYIPITHNKKQRLTEDYTLGTLLYNNQGNANKKESIDSKIKFNRQYNKPVVSGASVEIKEEEPAAGIYINLKEYNRIKLPFPEYKLLDEEGKVLNEWEELAEPVVYEEYLENLDMEYSRISEDGEYFVLFKIIDLTNNSYYTNLIEIK